MAQWCDLPNLTSPNPPGPTSLTKPYSPPPLPPPPARRTIYVTPHVVRESAPRPSWTSSSSPASSNGSYGGGYAAGSSSIAIKDLAGRSGALWLILWYSIVTLIISLICVCGLGGVALYLLGSGFGEVDASKIFRFTFYLSLGAAALVYGDMWDRSKVTLADTLDAIILLVTIAVGIVLGIIALYGIGYLIPMVFAK